MLYLISKYLVSQIMHAIQKVWFFSLLAVLCSIQVVAQDPTAPPVPPTTVQRLNLAIENGAWGAFDTEIYLTYDDMPICGEYTDRREDSKEDRK